MIVKYCELCGQEYDAYKGDQRYCSDCKDEARRRRQRSTDFAVLSPPVDYVRLDINEAPDGEKVISISDLHYPFTDRRTWSAVVNFINDFKPDKIIWNGDIGDFFNISVFDKSRRRFDFVDEMSGLREFLALHRKAWASSKHYYLDGNHENRLDDALKKTELGRIASVESVLELKEMGFVHLPYGGVLNYLGCAITHGTRFSSLPNGTARMHADMIGGSGVVGHSHRIGQWSYTDLRGTHTFREQGCLCRLDPDWVKQRPPNWQQGFLAGRVQSGRIHWSQVAVYPDGFYGPFTDKFYGR